MAHSVDSNLEELKKLFGEAKDYRQPFEPDWFLNIAFLVGDQWVFWNSVGRVDEVRLADWRVKYVDNRIRGIAMSRVARKTKQRPTWVPIPNDSSEEALGASEISRKILENDWIEKSLDGKYIRAQMWAEVCTKGFWKIFWDRTKGDQANFLYLNGQPVMNDKTGLPFKYEEAQPEFRSKIEEAEGVTLEKRTMAKGDVGIEVISPFEFYPQPGPEELEDLEYTFESKIRTREYLAKRYPKLDIDRLTEDADIPDGIVESRYFRGNSSGKRPKGFNTYEYYCRPNSTHPNGKWVVWVGDQIAVEGTGPESPYADFPYIEFGSQPVPGRFWDTAVTTDLRSPQTDLNKLQSLVRENAIRIGNPALMSSRQANVTYEGLPGEHLKYDDTVQNALPQYLEPPEMPSYVRNELERIVTSLAEISGLHEVSKGQVPPGLTAASAINLLQEADDTRIGPEITNNEENLARGGDYILKLRAKHMTDEQTVMLAGDDSNWDIFDYRNQILQKVSRVQVQAGSGMPRSKAARQAQMTEILGLALQYGLQLDPRSLRAFFRDFEAGGLERLFEDIQPNETQVLREHRAFYQGLPVDINDYDDHEYHIEGHEEQMKSSRYDRSDDKVKSIFNAHLAAHKEVRRLAIEAQVAAQQPEVSNGSDEEINEV